jgi:hypothetical protein
MVVSTGDQFFLPDSSQFYFDDLVGQKYLRYVPGTGHGLNDVAVLNAAAFYSALITGERLPEFTWAVESDTSIRVHTIFGTPTTVKLWQSTQPVSRDFRQVVLNDTNGDGIPEVVFRGPNWSESTVSDEGGGVFIGRIDQPNEGSRAFLIELTYDRGPDLLPLVFTTEVVVAESLTLKAILDGTMPIQGALAAAAMTPTGSADSMLMDASGAFGLSGAQISTSIVIEEASPTHALTGTIHEPKSAWFAGTQAAGSDSTSPIATDDLFDLWYDEGALDWQHAADELIDALSGDTPGLLEAV